MTDAFTDEFPSEDDTAGLTPAAEGSTLAVLRERREAARKKLHLDLEVPRLEPPVFVRFKPTTQARLNAASKQASKNAAQQDGEIVANTGILADSCLGVFEVIDGEDVSIDPDDRAGEWPKFGPRLADLLGLRTNKVSDVVRGLYLTDGDIISTVTKLGVWSGYAAENLERDPEGN